MVDFLIGVAGAVLILWLIVFSMLRVAALSDAQDELEQRKEARRWRNS